MQLFKHLKQKSIASSSSLMAAWGLVAGLGWLFFQKHNFWLYIFFLNFEHKNFAKFFIYLLLLLML